MVNPGQRHDRLAAGLFADQGGDLHLDVMLAYQYLLVADQFQRAAWWGLVTGAIAYRCEPIELSPEGLALLVADNQWEEIDNVPG